MDRLYIGLLALLGGLVAALMGWLDSKEPFDRRKFGGSAVRSLIAAAVFTVGYQLSDGVNTFDLFYAFLGGAGVDVLGNRIASSLGNGNFPVSKSKDNEEK
jgi:Na+/citrate or Na+/malate symporter